MTTDIWVCEYIKIRKQTFSEIFWCYELAISSVWTRQKCSICYIVHILDGTLEKVRVATLTGTSGFVGCLYIQKVLT